MALDDNDRRARLGFSDMLNGWASGLAATWRNASKMTRATLRGGRARARAAAAPWLAAAAHRIGHIWRWIEPWAQRQPVWRWCTKTIGRRILVANLFGFSILFIGLMVLSQMNRWLVDAKTDSLTTQARTIAVAIASNARVETGRLTFDPDRLDDAAQSRPPGGDDTFADIRLAIAPERVGPVLARLIPVGDVRARIYGPDGFQILDTNQRLQRGQLSRPPATGGQPSPFPEEKLRTTWTRFVALFTREGMNVYRDIPGERGTIYPEIRRALDGQTSHMLLVTAEGQQSVAVAQPIMSQGAVRGAIVLSSRPGDLDEVLWRQRRAMLVLSLIALVTSLVSAFLLRRTIAGPMSRLSEAAEHVSRSINAQHELPDYSNRRDEVGAMASAFKDMTDSLLRRIEASDRFAQDVAHELKNPVAAARSTAESLGYAKSEAQRDELVRQIQGELIRLNRLITDVAKASRLDAELALQETEPLDLAKLTTGVIGVLTGLHSDSGRRVTLTTADADPSAYMVVGHEGRLGQVMTNLVDNAVSFSAPGGSVRVNLKRDGANVVITVDDDGPGIPHDRLEHVFRRFYSDRPQSDRTKGKNSGLGLSISAEIVRVHGGKLWAENRPAAPCVPVGEHDEPELKERRIPGVAGARFVVVLPAMAPSTTRRPV